MLNVPLLLRAGRRDPDPRFLQLLVLAFVAKLAATAARWVMAFVLYNGSDAGAYSKSRVPGSPRPTGTASSGPRSVATSSGPASCGSPRPSIYVVTGPSFFVAWLVFSLLGFWGTYFLYRAFRVAVPDGNARRYAHPAAVPALDAVLAGGTRQGGLHHLRHRTDRLRQRAAADGLQDACAVPLLLGVAATAVVRPHITAALFTALVLAWFLRKRLKPANELTPLTYVGGSCADPGRGRRWWRRPAASFLGLGRAERHRCRRGHLRHDRAHRRGRLDLRRRRRSTARRTCRWAAFTVVFRPMVFEATNPQMLLAAVEGSLLLAAGRALAGARCSSSPAGCADSRT